MNSAEVLRKNAATLFLALVAVAETRQWSPRVQQSLGSLALSDGPSSSDTISIPDTGDDSLSDVHIDSTRVVVPQVAWDNQQISMSWQAPVAYTSITLSRTNGRYGDVSVLTTDPTLQGETSEFVQAAVIRDALKHLAFLASNGILTCILPPDA